MYQLHLYGTRDPDALGILVVFVIPAVFLLVLLFNAWRMRLLQKKWTPPGRVSRARPWTFGICLLLVILLLSLSAAFLREKL